MKQLINYTKASPFYLWGFTILDKWMQIKNSGKSLKMYFEDNLLSSVAIYGLGALGKRLFEELQRGQIEVCYGIDKNARNIRVNGLDIKTLNEPLNKVDAVIVTPMDFYEIKKSIELIMGKDVNIIFIEDVVDYCFNQL